MPDEPTHWSATQIARRVAQQEISAVEVTRAFIAQIEQVNRSLNAVVVPLFESALAEAAAADARQQRGEPLGPLHGVPITVKECFHVAGTPSCIGLTRLRDELLPADGILIERLRRAGAILLGKTNVPQLMLWHECDNPVYGRTNNPWDTQRTPGGSSGGEAAIIAARGSPLGLANDLGGSLRIPAHFCGIAALKPTSLRFTREGARGNFRGLEAVVPQPGPIARHVEDLWLMFKVLAESAIDQPRPDEAPVPLRNPAEVQIDNLRIAYWDDDGFFPASAAIRRAVSEAAGALRARGAIVERFQPDFATDAVETFTALLAADGATDARKLARGSTHDWRLSRLLTAPSLWRPTRHLAVWSLKAMRQRWLAQMLQASRPRSAYRYWKLTERKNQIVRRFLQSFAAQRFDAFLSPPHALPAMQHGKPIDLLPAASYAYLPNLLGIPAGVVPVTHVREGEDTGRPASRDRVEDQARAVDVGSVGLPIAVQVAATPWREDVVLAIQTVLEEAFSAEVGCV